MILLGKIIRVLFGGSWVSLMREREQFFHNEIVKAYDAHDYKWAEFLSHTREVCHRSI